MALVRHLLASAIAVSIGSTALAGPVERELLSRKGEVATPDPRPVSGQKTVPDDVLPDDIPGGRVEDDDLADTAPQADVTLPAPRNSPASPQVIEPAQKPTQENRKPQQTIEENQQTAEPTRRKPVELKSEKKPDPASKPRPQRVVSAQCIPELAAKSDAQTSPSPKGKYPECRIQQPISVTTFSGPMPVSLSSQATVDCVFATALSNYITYRAQPLAQIHLETQLTKITAGTGFQCRRRNNALTGKLSEHAFGYGLDILSFSFADGTVIDVRDSSGMKEREAAYFNAVREGACDYFTTVLGPGSNAAHATHLHLDLGRTIGNPNPYRICE
ncbi:extensin family protein [Ahrensia sp. R2A130]|uniref:extensin-like domain-containing protein n=1 Tax=Ahrensia sp. R2A130 TaxID=744979 RepID=UPI0001E0D0BB|nr:extensin family protein [Ahrensia sp. R2A130]EFL90860.1 extensin family protein [Ahrensia sp. R2A130]